MKTILVIFVIIAFFAIDPLFAFVTPTTTIIAAPLPIISQFHSQDSLGQYAYGYNGGPSIKSETKTIDGIIRGSYSYIDPDGKLQTVEYTADALNGFRAAATNLPRAPVDDKLAPEPVQETPEVAKARAEHLEAYKEAEIRAAKYPEEPIETQENEVAISNVNGNENGNANGNGNGNNGDATLATGEQAEVATVQALPATVQTLPAGTSLSLPSSITTLKAFELPVSTYNYRIENPFHGVSVVAPTILTSPLTTGYSTLTSTPLIAGVRPITVATRILADRSIDLFRTRNGNGGHGL